MTRVPPADPALGAQADLRRQLLQLSEQQQRLVAQLQAGEQQMRQLARSVWRVQEDERRRLARDLHDGIGQHLTALRHRLDRLADPNLADAEHTREQAVELCELAISETRLLSRLLRPQVLDDLGLEAALRWLARQTAESSGCQVEIATHQLPEPLDGDLSTLIFRIVQEALTNAIKHAQARSIGVRIHRRGNRLQVLIIDDGHGCEVAAAWAKSSQGQSTGLASMRERVRLFGGQLALDSQPGEGVQLRVTLPLGEELHP